MMRIDGVTPEGFDMLFHALNTSKPKTDEDYENAAEAKKIFNSHLEKKNDMGTRKFKGEETVSLRMENSVFRYLETHFKEARQGGALYTGAASEGVVDAMRALKGVKDEKKEAEEAAKKAAEESKNGNRVGEALAK